jgi:hypothetical protein
MAMAGLLPMRVVDEASRDGPFATLRFKTKFACDAAGPQPYSSNGSPGSGSTMPRLAAGRFLAFGRAFAAAFFRAGLLRPDVRFFDLDAALAMALLLDQRGTSWTSRLFS